MNTKEKIVRLLCESQGKYLSGEEIAANLGISRSAVWKAITALKADGYEINAVQNKGYCIDSTKDILSSAGIIKNLSIDLAKTVEVSTFREVDSTNLRARDLAKQGAHEDTSYVQYLKPPDVDVEAEHSSLPLIPVFI